MTRSRISHGRCRACGPRQRVRAHRRRGARPPAGVGERQLSAARADALRELADRVNESSKPATWRASDWSEISMTVPSSGSQRSRSSCSSRRRPPTGRTWRDSSRRSARMLPKRSTSSAPWRGDLSGAASTQRPRRCAPLRRPERRRFRSRSSTAASGGARKQSRTRSTSARSKRSRTRSNMRAPARPSRCGFRRDRRLLRFEFTDDGVGVSVDAAPTGDGIGMTSMRDRIGAVGGDLEVISSPGRGTTVRGSGSRPRWCQRPTRRPDAASHRAPHRRIGTDERSGRDPAPRTTRSTRPVAEHPPS